MPKGRKEQVRPEKKEIGAPTKYDKDFHPKSFIEQSRLGKQVIQIATSWEVHRDTVYEWAKVHPEFSDAFKMGRQFCQSAWIELGVSAMMGVQKIDLGFYCYLTKATLGWRDNSRLPEDEDDLDTEVTPYEKA